MKEKGLFIISLLFLILALNIIYAEEAQAVTTPDIQGTTNSFLSQEVVIPQNLQILARTIFGLTPDSNIELSVFIVLVTLLIGIFFIVRALVTFIPIFEENWVSWFISAIITILISITGSIRDSAIWLFGLGQILKNQTLLKVMITIIVLAIIVFGVLQLLNLFGKSTKKATKRQLGRKIGAGID